MIILASSVFLVGYILIALEHKLQVSKSAIAMLFAGILWTIVAIADKAGLSAHLSKAGAGIFEILVFLLSAMTLVEILVHYRFFDVVRSWLISKRLDNVRMLWIMSALSFWISAVIDNMTTAIIFSQLARLFFRGKNLVVAAALIVVAANAGGAFSPIGDVTTTMLWLGGKFSSFDVMRYVLVPTMVLYLVAAFLMTRKLKGDETLHPETEDVKLLKSEKLVITSTFISFTLPFVFHSFGLRPYMGLLVGLGITWILIDTLKKQFPNHRTHFNASIEKLLQKTDIASLKFFVGILLAVAALDHLGILDTLSNSLFGHNPGLSRYVVGSSIMGALSALVDNVPLTAASMHILKTTDSSIWSLIALTVGTGGSMLVIGSAAGVVAMGIVKELNFFRYLKVAAIPAALGYMCAIAVWYLQRLIF